MSIEIIILLLAIPSGFLIAWLCRDELIAGRKWFAALTLIFFVIGWWFFLAGNYVIMHSCFFITITAFISYYKSKDKRWTKRRI